MIFFSREYLFGNCRIIKGHTEIVHFDKISHFHAYLFRLKQKPAETKQQIVHVLELYSSHEIGFHANIRLV